MYSSYREKINNRNRQQLYKELEKLRGLATEQGLEIAFYWLQRQESANYSRIKRGLWRQHLITRDLYQELREIIANAFEVDIPDLSVPLNMIWDECYEDAEEAQEGLNALHERLEKALIQIEEHFHLYIELKEINISWSVEEFFDYVVEVIRSHA